MIKKLQWKFIVTTMSILLMVFGVVFITLNIFMQTSSVKQTEKLLESVASQDGIKLFKGDDKDFTEKPPNQGPPHDSRAMKAGRFFYVKVDASGNVLESDYGMMLDFTEEDAVNYTVTVLAKKGTTGRVDNYQYLVSEKDYGKIVVFAERSIEIQMLDQLIKVSLIVALISSAIFLVISIFLSRWAIAPVKNAFDKQRIFISDASHELKTPLTIISANADVLEREIGHNVRVDHIKSQSLRMSELIHNLLTLARTDEETQVISKKEFSLSSSVLNTVLEFESRAFEEKKELLYEIEENVDYLGNEKQLKQVVTTLLDNALKYSGPIAKVRVVFAAKNGKITLEVFNSGVTIPEEEREKIFQRFYRSDQSRSRETGGYGLGLAIAKAIVENHNGKISVSSSPDGETVFLVRL